ncbi:MAG: DNA starvation/stationary phase protection protein [Thermodesulfobacteriota bacterium]|jgi:starvation-inducible DNA-binding protein
MALEQTQAQPTQSREQHRTPASPPGEKTPQSAQALSEEISKENRPDNAVVRHLQRQVANAYVLYLNYKHYHWNTYGPLFRDLHLLFDEFAEAVLKTADKFAERIRMIGQDPVYHPAEMVKVASVKVAEPKQTMRDMIAEADTNLLGVIKDMREAVYVADEQHDPGTADLFTDAVQVHEKHEWWLRDILEKRDGLAV